ncbi:PCM1, partial [Symbiodinium sp. KB8]
AKLVRNRGGVLVGYQDSEPIRGRRRLLFLGPSLWRDGDVGDEAPSAGDSDSEEPDGAAPGTLSLEKARRFLHRVKNACASQSFQQSVAELRARARQRGETTGTRMAVGTLFIAACQSILRKFGFGIDRQGYEQMFTAIFPHGQDPTILALASDIEKLLGVPVGSWFGLANEGIQDGSAQLSRDEARQVVTEIRRLVGSPTFQKEVVAIRDGVRSRNGSLQEVSQEVYMPFYRLVRPITLAFRLGGDPQCLARMSAALAPHLEDAQLRAAVRQVETSFLHTHPGAFFATSQDAPQGSVEATVKIRIRHAVSGAEVPLTVPASSTMGEIREALAKAVESEEVWRNGRLVESRQGGAFTSFKDGEKLHKRRRLLFLGADLPTKQINGAAKVKLTRQQAVELQNELLEGFRSGDFQERFRELQAKFPDGGATFYVERRKLVLSVQTKVIPKYGFAADLSGVFDMVRLLGTLPDEENEIGRRGWEIERLIGERETSHENAQAKDVDAGIDTEASDEVLDVQPAPDTDAENSARGENQFMNALDQMEDEGMTSFAEVVLAESDGHDSFVEKQAVEEVKLPAGASPVSAADLKTTRAEPADVTENPSLDQHPASGGQEAEETSMHSGPGDAETELVAAEDMSSAQPKNEAEEAMAEDSTLDQRAAAPGSSRSPEGGQEVEKTATHSTTHDEADAELVAGEASAVQEEDRNAAQAETVTAAEAM